MIERINNIFIEWDPIELGKPLCETEYKQYANLFVWILKNENEIKEKLIYMLDQMGLEYDEQSEIQKKILIKVVKQLSELG